MATISGNNGTVFVGSGSVAEIKSFSLTVANDVIETTPMGVSFKSFTAGLSEASGEITCHLDVSDTDGQESLTIGSEVSLDLRPNGDSSGNPKFTLTGIVNNIAISQTINDIVERSFSFQGTGGVTQSTI
jgi:hypothetical protein